MDKAFYLYTTAQGLLDLQGVAKGPSGASRYLNISLSANPSELRPYPVAMVMGFGPGECLFAGKVALAPPTSLGPAFALLPDYRPPSAQKRHPLPKAKRARQRKAAR